MVVPIVAFLVAFKIAERLTGRSRQMGWRAARPSRSG